MRWLVFGVWCFVFGMSAAIAQEDTADTKRTIIPDETPIVEAPITAADREHWAFKPVQHPKPPVVLDKPQQANQPLDHFILAKLEDKGLAFAPRANRST